MDSIFKIKSPNENHPYISKYLKIGYDKGFGRFVYANKQINTGEVLIVEEPFFYSIDVRDDELTKRCAYCLDVCKGESLVCPVCKNSFFCTQECFNKSFHKSECSLVGKADKDDGYFLLMTRTLIKSIEICGGLENFQTFIDRRNKKLTLLDAPDSDYVKLNSCYNLECGNFPQDLKFAKTFVESEKIKLLYKNADQKFFLVRIIMRILGILNRNSFCIEFSDGNNCGAVFPFASLINHSCSPNIERFSMGKKTAFVSIRPIKENEQIFICYRKYFYTECDYEQRQREIYDQFSFLCQCEACNDPESFFLPYKDEEQAFSNSEEELKSLLSEYDENCKFITLNVKKYPCLDIVIMIAKNIRILQHLADVNENKI